MKAEPDSLTYLQLHRFLVRRKFHEVHLDLAVLCYLLVRPVLVDHLYLSLLVLHAVLTDLWDQVVLLDPVLQVRQVHPALQVDLALRVCRLIQAVRSLH